MRAMGLSVFRCLFAVLVLVGAPAWAPAAVLSVDDSGDPGTVGDTKLSLREAIQLATGHLDPATLSNAERAHITGSAPGAASADTIKFAFSGTIALAGDGSAEVLPPLDTGNDTIDGEGKIVLSGLNVTNPGSILFGLHISSSGNTLRGLALEDIPGSVLLLAPPTGGTVSGTQIVNNRITRPGIDAIRLVAAALPAAGATVSGGLVDGTVVQGNTIEGQNAVGMNVMAAYAAVPGTISSARITNTTVSDNTIQDVIEGLFVRAAAGDATLTGNEVGGLVVARNTFLRLRDLPLFVGASNVSGAGASSDNVVHDVTVADNVIRDRVDDPNFHGGAMFFAGGLLDDCGSTQGSPTSMRDRTANVQISNNQIADRPRYGIFLQGGQSCGGVGGTLTDSVLEQIQVTGNTIGATSTGISMVGVSSYDTGGAADHTGNTVRGVTISGNSLTSNDSAGVEFIGAYAAGGRGPGVSMSGNSVADVTVQGNTFTDDAAAVAVNGAISGGGGAEVSDNAVQGAVIDGNTISGCSNSGVAVLGVGAQGSTRMESNRIEALQVSNNDFEGSKNVAVILLMSVPNGHSGVGGNAIAQPTIAGNSILDTTAGNQMQGVGIALIGTPSGAITNALIDQNTIRGVARHGIQLTDTNGHTVSGNVVSDYGGKAFIGKKRKNHVVGNVFAPKRKRRR